jgi:hypothetical protein
MPDKQGRLETPVALMMFNRPDLTAQVFAAIRRARPRRLLVVADGPRRPDEKARCDEARAQIKVDWDCELLTNYSDVNLGCKRRVASGISWVFEQCEEAIILEDDTIPVDSFFPYCQELLARYRDDERVMCICGMNLFPRSPARGDETYFFSRYGATNGWASWRRAWKYFDVDMSDWPEFKRSGRIKDLFPTKVEQIFWTMLFDAQYRGKINTWDFQWLYARLANGGLIATPVRNMVVNLGFRADGTHTQRPMPRAFEPATTHHDTWEWIAPRYVIPYREVDDHYFDIFNPWGAAGLALMRLDGLAQDLRSRWKSE